jgi:hypothetical protein
MNLGYSMIGAVAALGTVSAAHAGLIFDDVQVELWTGAGEQEALLVIDWQAGRQIAFGYRWSALETPTDRDMLDAIVGATDRLQYVLVPDVTFDAIFGIGWDADDDGLGDPDDWYEEGWLENGFWGQWASTDGTSWDFANGFGFEDLADGDWIGWSWAPEFVSDPPTVPLVPAPPAALALGFLVTARRRRPV